MPSSVKSSHFLTRALICVSAWLILGAGLALAWRWTPLNRLDTETLIRWSEPFAQHAAAPFVIICAYAAASFILFPRPLLTLAFIVIFGPWRTALYGITGLLVAAAVAFWFGAVHGAPPVRKLAHQGLDLLTARLRSGGIFSVIVIRMLPIAPYTVVNLLAGALKIRFSDFMIGSFFGLLPGTLTTITIGDRLIAALHQADGISLVIALAVAAAAATTFCLLRRSVQ